MKRKEFNSTKQEMICTAKKAVADKKAWMKAVSEGTSIQKLRNEGVRVVKLQ
ncbi:hypothetical protein [uncultured Parabacteroides sp.]|jgi:hypothetical protein|uniref:hypothetical protein n=1 Tax=uncultured Parabacteroides sp. TaxID=512312 RepID=UPI0025D123A7|nr:hypothetical protein [uncultured Parabacteroides sp.]